MGGITIGGVVPLRASEKKINFIVLICAIVAFICYFVFKRGAARISLIGRERFGRLIAFM